MPTGVYTPLMWTLHGLENNSRVNHVCKLRSLIELFISYDNTQERL